MTPPQIDPGLHIAPASSAEVPAALALLWPDADDAQRRRRYELAAGNAAETCLLWCARRAQCLVATMRLHLQPGRTALVAAPRLAPEAPPSTASALVTAALDFAKSRGALVAQALVASDDAEAGALQAGGLRHVADLLYLVSLRSAFPQQAPRLDLTLCRYDQAGHERLARVLARTYRNSLDCPATEGIRSSDDVLAGYRGAGPFDPQRWLVAARGTEDVGCLLLGDLPQEDQYELTYLGIVPEARGRGWGLQLVREAQWRTGAAGRSRLVVAVDAANEPALDVYQAAGFIACDERRVYWRAL